MLKTFCHVALTATLACSALSVSAAATNGTKDEAMAMIKKATAHYKKVGKEKALADFTTKGGPFTDRDLYVYTADLTGKVTSHGANDKLLGRDLMQLKDADGKLFIVEILDKVKAGKSGWTDYKWVNPVSKDIEQKTAYCEPLDNQVICVGVYK